MTSGITKRRVQLGTAGSPAVSIVIGRSSRAVAAAHSRAVNATDKLLRVEQEGNLLFDERTISKTHAYVHVDFDQVDKDGIPSVVLEDYGSQHGIVWGQKRIPQNAKIRIRQNDIAGFVDVLNKNQSDQNSFHVDSDTVFFTPDKSWKDGSLNLCKVLLQFSVSFNYNSEGEQVFWLEVQQLDPKTLKDSVIDCVVGDDVEIEESEPFEIEESVEIITDEVPEEAFSEDIFSVNEDEISGLEAGDDIDDDDGLVKNYTIQESIEYHDHPVEDVVASSLVDEINEDQTINSLKRKYQEDDEVEESETVVSQIDTPSIKRQKVGTSCINVKSHIMAGVTGMTVGAFVTFAYLASLGEKFMETV